MVCSSRTVGSVVGNFSDGCDPAVSHGSAKKAAGRLIAKAVACVFAVLMITTGAHAGSGSAPQQVASVGLSPPQNSDPSFITISGGWFDIFDNDDEAAALTAEWRSNRMFWIFKPFVGATATTDAAVYGFGGVLTDFYFGRRIVVSPSVAIGLYADGDGKDLGSIFEIRSGLEVGWRFDNRARLSAAIYHISNAGVGSSNPGTEIVSIGYSFPLR